VSAPSDDVTRVAATLRRYLRAYPQSADTVEGIRRIWLADCAAAQRPAVLAAALERLVRAGELERLALPDGRVVFRGPARPR
jgi:uncharacterized heparinase superfamily protein